MIAHAKRVTDCSDLIAFFVNIMPIQVLSTSLYNLMLKIGAFPEPISSLKLNRGHWDRGVG